MFGWMKARITPSTRVKMPITASNSGLVQPPRVSVRSNTIANTTSEVARVSNDWIS